MTGTAVCHRRAAARSTGEMRLANVADEILQDADTLCEHTSPSPLTF
ncbi:hypothetical protein [Sphingomonas sp. 2378]